MLKTTLVAIALGGVLAGCVRTSTVRLGDTEPHPPVHPSEVVIFINESDVPGEFVKVAYISAEGAHGFTTEKGMVEKVQREAAKLGANGVILNEIEEPSAGAKIAAGVLGTTAQRTGKMLAIRYKADRSAQASPFPALGDYKLPASALIYPVKALTSKPVTTLPPGTVVTVVGREADWALVRYDSGRQGYVQVSQVQPTPILPSQQDAPLRGPCADSLYQELKKKDLNAMTEREFAIFQERDRACAAFQSGGKGGTVDVLFGTAMSYRHPRNARRTAHNLP